MGGRVLVTSASLLLLALSFLSGLYLNQWRASQITELERRLSLTKLAVHQAEETSVELRARLFEAVHRAHTAEAAAHAPATSCGCNSTGGELQPQDVAGQGTWERTETNVRLWESVSRVANSRREIMLGLANDVMMCSNRKTCWWNGGNILSDFLFTVQRLQIENYLVLTLDNATESFCRSFGTDGNLGTHGRTGVNSLRVEIPVPTAQQGSRGANMISTLKYGLLGTLLQMGVGVLVVDLDLVFLKDPFLHLYRDADVEASTDGFTRQVCHPPPPIRSRTPPSPPPP